MSFTCACAYVFAEVLIGFIDLLYEANENEGFASVTFGVLSIGALQREVRVGIQLSDGTALSKQLTKKQTDSLLTY